MDKYESKLRIEEIEKLKKKRQYKEAARLADTIEWYRIKNAVTLYKVADLYKRYRAKKIVIETNAGGDLLDEILLREDSSLNIKKVRAKESKICRAQPVVILYQKNLVFHAKQFRELEMEMVTYEPGQKSPDRMDALVWALTDLFEIEASSYAPRAFLI